MKKILILLIACLAVGCDDSTHARKDLINNDKENNPYLGRFKQYGTGTEMTVIVDTQTGCEYLSSNRGGIQPFNDCRRK